MKFDDLILKRQSCRNFDADRKVSEEDMTEIIKAGLLSPSARNSQPWRLYLTTTEKSVNEVKSACQPMGRNPFLKNAQTFVVVAMKRFPPVVKPKELCNIDWRHFDCGLCVSQMILKAESLGISSCMIGSYFVKELADAVNLPPEEDLEVVVAFGYPAKDDTTREKNRLPFGDSVTKV